MTPEELKAAMDDAHARGDVGAFIAAKRQLQATKVEPTQTSPISSGVTTYHGKTGEPLKEYDTTVDEELGYAMRGAARGVLETPRAFGGSTIAPALADKLRQEQDAMRQEPGSRTVLESLEEVPGIAASMTPVGKAVGVGASLARIAAQAGLGYAGGAMAPADTEEAQETSAGLGAVLGGGAQSVGEAVIGGRNLAMSRFREADALQSSARGRRLEKMTGTKMTLGQLSGDPQILRMEAEAAGQAKEEFYRTQMPRMKRYFDRIAEKFDPKRTPDAKMVQEMEGAFDEYMGVLRTYRRLGWAEDMGKVSQAAGDSFTMVPKNLMSKLQTLSEEHLKIGSKLTPAESAVFGKEIDKILAKGHIDIGDLDSLLQQYTQEGAKSGNLFKDMQPNTARRLAGELRDALEKDMDAFSVPDVGPGRKGSEVVAALKQARTNYAKASEAIDEMHGTVLERWFGKEGHLVPETVLDKLSKLPPSELRRVTEVVNTIDPSIMERARGQFINGAVNKTYKAVRKSGEPAFAMEQVAKYLEQNPEHFRAAFPKNTDRQDILTGIATLRHLSNRIPDVPEMSLKEFVGGGAINAINRDPGFIARHITKAFAPGQMSKLLFTDEGRMLLTTLQTPSPSWAQKAAAAAALNRIMVED